MHYFTSMTKTKIAGIFILGLFSFIAGAGELDSLRVEEKNGQKFIVHEVEPKETLYSISRRYDVVISDIIAHNPEIERNLMVGYLLMVPVNSENPPEITADKGVHTVRSKETLFSISQLYEVDVLDLKKWNDLSTNELAAGRKIFIRPPEISGTDTDEPITEAEDLVEKKYHVVSTGETLYSIARKYGTKVNIIKDLNQLDDLKVSIGQKLLIPENIRKNRQAKVETDKPVAKGADDDAIKNNAATEKTTTKKPVIIEKETVVSASAEMEKISDDYRQIKEEGLAEMIEGDTESKKYLALHRTAPVGTIIQIKNEMNGKRVFVRVVGKLPNTGNNDKVLIKISKAAYKRLGALDTKFPIVLSYVL